MEIDLLENPGEFRGSEKGLLSHVNKSAFRTTKHYGATDNVNLSIKGIIYALSRELALCDLGAVSLIRKASLSELWDWNIAQYSSLSRAELQGHLRHHAPMHTCLCVQARTHLCHRVPLFATPWTVGHRAPLSMGFLRQ